MFPVSQYMYITSIALTNCCPIPPILNSFISSPRFTVTYVTFMPANKVYPSTNYIIQYIHQIDNKKKKCQFFVWPVNKLILIDLEKNDSQKILALRIKEPAPLKLKLYRDIKII